MVLCLLLWFFSPDVFGDNTIESNSQRAIATIMEIDSDNGISVLEGEMAFYWNQLLTPRDFENDLISATPAIIKFPDTWNQNAINQQKIPGRGFATYRCQFDTDNNPKMGIKIKDYCNAYRLWINGELIAQGGKPGPNKEETLPVKVNTVAYFTPQRDTNELVLQTANFSEKYGGFRQSFLMGEASIIRQKSVLLQVVDAFVLGLILMMALYHLGLFLLNRRNKSFLWFGFLAFFIFLRHALLSDIQFLDEWLSNNISLYLKTTIVSAILTSLMLYMFFQTVFPQFLKMSVAMVYSCIIVLFILFIILAPIYHVSVGIHYFQVVVQLALLYILFLTIKLLFLGASREKWMIAVGILLFILSTAVESLIFNRIIYSEYVLHYGLVLFIVFQSYALSADFSRTNKLNRELSDSLEFHNRNLKKMVLQKSREALEAKERELLSVLMQKSSTDNLLKQISERLQKMNGIQAQNEEVVKEILNTIRSTVNEDETDKYLMHFEKIHPGFFKTLPVLHPSLTSREIKLCAYLKLNLGHKEIADILHVEPESVRKAKSRMRRKMGLSSDRDIQSYVGQF